MCRSISAAPCKINQDTPFCLITIIKDMQNQYKLLLRKLINHSLWGMVIQCLLVTSIFASGVNKETNTRESGSLTSPVRCAAMTVTGTVTSSEDASVLPGVSIAIKGTSQGTTTDADGKYTL